MGVGDYIVIGEKIAEAFGFIEGVSKKVDKILHQSLKSANEHLESAARCKKKELQLEYVKSARECYIQAISVEENRNKVIAYCGLALSYYLLCDLDNAKDSLDKIKYVELTLAERSKNFAKTAFYKTIETQPHNMALKYGIQMFLGKDMDGILYEMIYKDLSKEGFDLFKEEIHTLTKAIICVQ